MDARIYIAIPCHGRKNIAELCIPTVKRGMAEEDHLACFFDDMDDGFDTNFITTLGCKSLCVDRQPIGIERQRARHFRLFSGFPEFTHLYLTDSDALHDPDWRNHALQLQEKYNGAPICLYNTDAHVRLVGNAIEDDPQSDVIWRRVAPGISYLLTRKQAEKVASALPHLPDHWHWDWTVPAILGHRMAVSRVSYVDHIGHGGMHHPKEAGLEGGDVALNPTWWLMEKRREVISLLKENDHSDQQ